MYPPFIDPNQPIGDALHSACIDDRAGLELLQLERIPVVGLVPHPIARLGVEGQLGQSPRFPLVRDRPLDLDVAQDAEVEEQPLELVFQIVIDFVELCDRRVANLERAVLATFRGPVVAERE